MFTADGFLLTNAHVVGSSRSGTVAFADCTSGGFTVVGRDPLSDLAMIRAQTATPEPADLGDSDEPVVRQLVVAVGDPLGLSGSSPPGSCPGSAARCPSTCGGAPGGPARCAWARWSRARPRTGPVCARAIWCWAQDAARWPTRRACSG
nr:trypsin-like peptidase domain-containing protein [Nonomuraea sp. K271]